MAGVPFEPIEELANPEAIMLARKLAGHMREFAKARGEAEHFIQSRERLLTEEAFRALRVAVKHGSSPAEVAGEQPPIFSRYAAAAKKVADTETRLEQLLNSEVDRVRQALLGWARTFLPRHLIFSDGGVRELLNSLLAENAFAGAGLAHRNCRAGERERHLLLYLQRVCTKNDSFSEFGPTGWGTVVQGNATVQFAPVPGIAGRETFLERWTALAAAAAMNAAPEVFEELSPRLHPNGRIDDHSFVFTETGEIAPLEPNERDLLRSCNGETPVHALRVPANTIQALLERQMLLCAVEAPAMEPYAFHKLSEDVRKWRPGVTRETWLSLLQPALDLAERFEGEVRTTQRRAILNEARTCLKSLGAESRPSQRFLYAAGNPIGEECVRQCNFEISEKLITEVAIEAAPWIDLWRDSYAYLASRVAAGLRGVLETMPEGDKAQPFPAFLRACEFAGLSLTGPGLVGLAHMAFQEVKAAFREIMEVHAGKTEHELTVEECHFVRRNFQYPKFDEYTYPSADLQLSARNWEAVGRGDYQWIVAELHPPAALLHHGAYWSCPDHAGLSEALSSTVFGRPSFHFGFFAADFTAHTTVRIFDALPELSNFVSPQRGNEKWKTVPPAEAEVYVDESSGDVCLRKRVSQEHLGSFARFWLIPLGFHPFYFGRAPHMPRLRCGNVIVQRRSWTLGLNELKPGDYTGISRKLLIAFDQLRAEKEWPRYIYIRPTEQALRRSGAEGRDKDTKPVFIDLESYLSLEIFHRWLKKAGELEITEMLPDPEHLCWQEADGRRTFELRTLIVPRA